MLMLVVVSVLRPEVGALFVNPSWQFAYEKNDSIWVGTADGKNTHELIRNARRPKWSPDGSRIAYVRGREIHIRSLQTNEDQVVANLSRSETNGGDALGRNEWKEEPEVFVNWDPRRPVLLISTEYTTSVRLVPVKPEGHWEDQGSGSERDTILGGQFKAPTFDPSWSPSGRRMAFSKAGDIWIANRGEMPRSCAIDAFEYYRESTRLAALAEFHDNDGGGLSASTPNWVTELDWTKDERRLVYLLRRIGGSGVWRIGYLEFTKPSADTFNLHRDIAIGICPRICPDGQTLSYAAQGENGRWDMYVTDWQAKHPRRIMADVLLTPTEKCTRLPVE